MDSCKVFPTSFLYPHENKSHAHEAKSYDVHNTKHMHIYMYKHMHIYFIHVYMDSYKTGFSLC